jgi:hypothetical protein
MRRRFWVGCGCFSLGGGGRGRGVVSKQSCLCYILYVEQWRFRCRMSSGHRERGFLDPRTSWADACDVSGFDNPSTCSHSEYSVGAVVFVPPRTPRSSGYDFLCTCGLCCYMLCVYYMLYVCYMSSSEPSCDDVFYRIVSFLIPNPQHTVSLYTFIYQESSVLQIIG